MINVLVVRYPSTKKHFFDCDCCHFYEVDDPSEASAILLTRKFEVVLLDFAWMMQDIEKIKEVISKHTAIILFNTGSLRANLKFLGEYYAGALDQIPPGEPEGDYIHELWESYLQKKLDKVEAGASSMMMAIDRCCNVRERVGF